MTNGPWGGPNQGPPGYPQQGGPQGNPQQGGPQGNPQQGGPQGYPNPGYPQGGPPSPGAPQGYRPPGPPAQPGAPYGVPQQGPSAPGGYRPGPGQPVPPPGAPNRNLLPIVVVGVLVVLLLGGGIGWFLTQRNKAPIAVATPSTPVTSARATSRPPSSAPATVATSRPATTAPTTVKTTAKTTAPAGQAPAMPAEVGGLKALGTPTNVLAMYLNDDASKTAMALSMPGVSVKEATAALANVTTIGAWTCGTNTGVQELTCATQSAFSSTLLITGLNSDATQLTGWGNEFVSKWK